MNRILAIFFTAIFLFFCLKANAQKIYWSDGLVVKSAHLDGSQSTGILAELLNTPENIELDYDNELIFYQTSLEDLFYANLYDGSGKTQVANYGAFAGFTDFAIIPANEYVFMNFWQEGSDGGIDRIGYYDYPLNPSSLPLNNPFDITDEEFNAIATDKNNEIVFFSVPVADYGIYSTDMNGSSWTQIRTGIFGDVMEFDNVREKLYFTNSSNNEILRMNANGSGYESVLSTSGNIRSIAINEIDGSVYWMEGLTIKRVEYDGSNVSNIITGILLPSDVEIYIDPSSIVVTNTNDSGPGSLRAAIGGSNIISGTQTIRFEIPGTGPHTITLSTALPAITDAVLLDGYTQSGSSVNTQADYDDAVIKIAIDGSSLSSGSGLDIQASNVTIRGLSIVNMPDHGIEINNTTAVNITGNFIGVSTNGTTTAQNDRYGVIFNSSSNCTIGGSLLSERNIISSNGLGEISVFGASSTGNTISGNFIGTDKTGQTGIASGNAFGIMIDEASGTTIGSSDTNTRNIIGDHVDGIVIKGSNASGNIVRGNSIGTEVNGIINIKNSSTGIYIHSGANNNIVGGVGASERNLIAFNANHGVLVDGSSSTGNSIRGNAIFCSAADNISLVNSGNADFANPVIAFVSSDSISGTAPANAFIDLYADYSGCSNNGSSEFKATVTSNSSGSWYFNSPDIFYSNEIVTAIATSSANSNSSPFSGSQTIPLGFTSATISSSNQYVDLEFDFGAYGSSSAPDPVDINDFAVSLNQNGGNPVTVTINSIQTMAEASLTGGETMVRLGISVTGYPAGVEELAFSAKDDSSIFDEGGMSLSSTKISPKVVLNPAPVITNSGFDFEICSGDNFDLDLTADISGTTYSWTAIKSSSEVTGVDAGGTSDPISVILTSTSTTAENVIITATPSHNGIEGEAVDFTVNILPTPDVVFSQTSDTICSDSAPLILLTSTIDPSTTFSWTASGAGGTSGFSDGSGSTINQTLSNTGATLASVTYSVTPLVNSCPGTPQQATISVKPIEDVQFTSTDFTTCNDVNTIDLEASATGAGPWDISITDGTNDYVNNNISSSPFTFSGITSLSGATTYNIKTAVDNHLGVGCIMNISGSTVTVTKIEEIIAILEAGDTAICGGVTNINIPISIAGGNTGPWTIDYTYNGAASSYTSSGRNAGISVAPVAGAHSFTLTGITDQSAPGCSSTPEGDITITQYTLPSASLNTPDGSGAITACQNELIELEITFSGTGPWEITLEDGTSQEVLQLSDNPAIIKKTVTKTQDFTYSLSSVKTLGENCEGTVSGTVSMSVTPIPGTPADNSLTGPTEVCHGSQNVAYSVAAISGVTEYEWTLTNGVTFSTGSPDIDQNINVNFPTNISSAQISVKGKNTCGTGNNEAVLKINVNKGANNPGAIEGDNDICQGAQSVNFSIPAIANATGYVWTLNHQDGTSEKNFTSSPSLTTNFPDNFTVASLEVAGYNTCDTSSQKSAKLIDAIPLPSTPQALTGPGLVCTDSEISVSVPIISNATQYVWELPAGFTPLSGSNITNLNSISLSAGSTSGSFSVNVYGKNQCGSGATATAALNIAVESSPELSIEGPSSAYLGQRVVFFVSEASGQTVASWQWNFGDGNTSTDQNASHTYYSGGFITVDLTATNSAQCESTIEHSVEVINDLPVTIMNVITPNGDGNNDGIIIDGIELFDENEVILFNRMGIKIFSFENYKNNWEELYKGPPLQAGNYVVVFKLKGTTLSKKQTVSVLN